MSFWDNVKHTTRKALECIKINGDLHYIVTFYNIFEYSIKRTVTIELPSKYVDDTIKMMKRYLETYPNQNERFRELCSRYPIVVSQIIIHNDKIERFSKASQAFKVLYCAAIENPNCFLKNSINQYSEIINEIKRSFESSNITGSIKEFVEEYNLLNEKIDEIRRQYNAKDFALSLLNIECGYLIYEDAEILVNKLIEVIPNAGEKHFYEFPSVKDLENKINENNKRCVEEASELICEKYEKAHENPIDFSNDLDQMLLYSRMMLDLEKKNQNGDLIDKYKAITIYFEEMQRQYISYIKAKELAKIEGAEYIVKSDREQLVGRLEKLIDTKGSPVFYDFPTVSYLEKIIEEHNENCFNTMAEILNEVHDRTIKNPMKFEVASIWVYGIVVSDIRYKSERLNEKEKRFIEQYEDLTLNLAEIRRQYKNKLKAWDLLNIKVDLYIDVKKRNWITEQLMRLMPKKGVANFYEFPTEEQIELSVEKHNVEFVEKHLKDSIFDNISGVVLDEDQRKAILCDERSNLVVAGAGSGKTLTICGKLKYLIEVMGVKPEEILLLSYSRASAEDLNEKARKISEDFSAKTFHALGLEILRKPNDEKFIINHQYDSIIREFFDNAIFSMPDILSKVVSFYGLYSSSIDVTTVYKNKSEMYESLKQSDFCTLKERLIKISAGEEKTTIKQEVVKSYEELIIANYYFLNGVNYEYEKPYKWHTANSEYRQYTPDFYLPEYDIYHEHYGINKAGNAIHLGIEDSQRYLEGMRWKRGVHRANNTKCIETYSYLFTDKNFFEVFREMLKENGVELKECNTDDIWSRLRGQVKDEAFNSFEKLIKTFVSLYKSMYRDDTAFEELKKVEFENQYENQRANLLLDICKAAYNYYKSKMQYITIDKSGELINTRIDFDDMILKSIEILPLYYNKFKYKYIIVDEFQDISHSRKNLLKALVAHGDAKLFMVGDDWQSIYRFSGSDVDIFTNAEKYFGKTKINFIKSTHRNSAELIEIMKPFITANDEQLKKTVYSEIHTNDPIRLVYYDNNKVGAFVSVLRQISKLKRDASVLVLGRTNNDYDKLLSGIRADTSLEHICLDEFSKMEIIYKTVHSAKGLEADYVILVNAENGRCGFPNMIEDDKILSLVLANKGDYPFAEERRLFYVAITRTRNVCFVLVNQKKPSVFIDEIKDKCSIQYLCSDSDNRLERNIICSNCGGRLVIRTNSTNGNKFLGCENYPYCVHTESISFISR